MSIVIPYSLAPAGLTNPDNRHGLPAGRVSLDWNTHELSNHKALIRQCLDMWTAISGAIFIEVTDGGQPIGRAATPFMRFYYLDLDNNRGNAYTPPNPTYWPNIASQLETYHGDIGIGKILYGGLTVPQFKNLILHEVGHAAFAMDHTSTPGSVMQGGWDVPNAYDAEKAQLFAGPPKTRAQELASGGVIGRVYHSYRAIKAADPDLDGLYYWTRELTWAEIKGIYPLRWQQFTDDFVTQLSSFTTANFISRLVQQILGRTATAQIIADDSNQIASIGRGAYLRMMIDSAEASNRRAALMTTKYWFQP